MALKRNLVYLTAWFWANCCANSFSAMEFSDLKALFNLLNVQQEENTIFQGLKTQGKPAHSCFADLMSVLPPELLLQRFMGALSPLSQQK